MDAGAAEWQLLSARAREWVDVAVDRGGAIERHRALFRDALVHV